MGLLEDFSDTINFGKRVEVHGKRWLILQGTASPGFFLAVPEHPEKESRTIMPAQVFLIHIKTNEKKTEEKKTEEKKV